MNSYKNWGIPPDVAGMYIDAYTTASTDVALELNEGGRLGDRLLAEIKQSLGFYNNPLVKCAHCGHWAAVMTECAKCGAPVDPKE